MTQRFCSNCGTPLAEGAVFCTACGTPAEGTAGAAQPSEAAQAAPPAAPAAPPHQPVPPPQPTTWQSAAPPQTGFGAYAPSAGTGQKKWVRYLQVAVGILALIAGAAAIYRVVKGTSAADLDCGEISSQITDLMENQVGGEVQVTDVEEVTGAQAREGQRRCTGIAKADDGSTVKVYMKSYEDGDNTMVSYSPAGFD